MYLAHICSHWRGCFPDTTYSFKCVNAGQTFVLCCRRLFLDIGLASRLRFEQSSCLAKLNSLLSRFFQLEKITTTMGRKFKTKFAKIIECKEGSIQFGPLLVERKGLSLRILLCLVDEQCHFPLQGEHQQQSVMLDCSHRFQSLNTSRETRFYT